MFLNRTQEGYVLLLVLWALVVLSVIASRSLDSLTDAQDFAYLEDAHIDGNQNQFNTLNHLLFLVARQRGAVQGLPTAFGFIKVDGTVYAGIGDTRFNIMDQHALININTLNIDLAENIASSFYGEGFNRTFYAQLTDYIDTDSWPEAGGAEQFQYNTFDRLGPADQWMRAPSELFLLPFFSNYDDLVFPDDLWRNLTSIGTGKLNVNAAEVDRIASLNSLQGITMTPLINARLQGDPIYGLSAFKQLLGLPLNWPIDYDEVSFGLSRYVRLNIWQTGDSSLTEYNLINTPNKLTPWRIVYVRKHPIPRQWSSQTPLDNFRQAIETSINRPEE